MENKNSFLCHEANMSCVGLLGLVKCYIIVVVSEFDQPSCLKAWWISLPPSCHSKFSYSLTERRRFHKTTYSEFLSLYIANHLCIYITFSFTPRVLQAVSVIM